MTKDGKLNVVLDLDSTIIFSTPTMPYVGTWTNYVVIFNATATSHSIGFRVNAASGSNVGSVGVDEVSISIESSVNENSVSYLQISPNPATSELTITNHQSLIESIHIYNVLGEEVMEMLKPVQHDKAVVDVSGLKAGVYFVEIIAADAQIVRKKFIKQ